MTNSANSVICSLLFNQNNDAVCAVGGSSRPISADLGETTATSLLTKNLI